MSDIASEGAGYDVAQARRQNALSLVFLLLTVFCFILRFFMPPVAMDNIVSYTTEGGSFYEKMHFGTYAIYLLLPIALFSRPFYLEGDDIGRFKDLLRFTLLIALLVVLMLGIGRTSGAGLFLDSYLVAGAAGLIMLAMNRPMRRIIGDAVLVMVLVNAAIGIGEFIVRERIIYYRFVELTFRPTGLTDHPLTFGLTCGASIAFVALTRWKLWLKLSAITLLLVATVASGARFALVLTVFEVLALVLFVRWSGFSPRNERRAKFAVLLIVLAGGALMFAALSLAGALSRFEGGMVDENFFARTDIYKIFGMVGWQQIVFGGDLIAITEIINEKLNLPYIESSPVYMTFLVGAPLAACIFALLFWLYGRLLKHVPRQAWIGTIVYIVAALSNNLLTTKTPVIAMFVVLILAYAHPRAEPRTTRI